MTRSFFPWLPWCWLWQRGWRVTSRRGARRGSIRSRRCAMSDTHLVVGATGLLGGEICRLLAERGDKVRALVRATANPERLVELKKLGAELSEGDLKDGASLDRACRGAHTVISTASATLSRQTGDSIQTVDMEGQMSLVKIG